MQRVKKRRERQVRTISSCIDFCKVQEEAATDPEVRRTWAWLREGYEVALDVPRAFGGTASPEDFR